MSAAAAPDPEAMPEVGPDPEDPDFIVLPSGGRARRCTARATTRDDRCLRAATEGYDVCEAHGLRAPQVKKAKARRLATARAEKKLADWGYEPLDDPFAAMADFAGRARGLVDALSSELAEGKATAATVEALGVALERAHRMAKDLASTGIDERRLRLDEQREALLAAVVLGTLRRAGLDPDDPQVQGWLEATYAEIEAGG